MVNIPSNKFYETTGNFVNKYIKKPGMKRFLEKGLKDPAGSAAKIMVLSFVSKDAVNCVIYTSQSAFNKEIPDEKRPFVMFNDLINGILNVAGQLASFSLVEKWLNPKQFGKHYSGTLKDFKTKECGPLDGTEKAKLYGDNLKDLAKSVMGNPSANDKTNKLAEKIRKQNPELIEELKNVTANDKAEIENIVSEKLIKRLGSGSSRFGSIEKGFGLLVGALATTALIKRTLVPLISTPIAGKLSDKAEAKKRAREKQAQQSPEERLLELQTTPWAYTGNSPNINKTKHVPNK